MAATNLSPNLETEDPEGSWVERSSVLINRAFAHGVQLREIFFNFVRYLGKVTKAYLRDPSVKGVPPLPLEELILVPKQFTDLGVLPLPPFTDSVKRFLTPSLTCHHDSS